MQIRYKSNGVQLLTRYLFVALTLDYDCALCGLAGCFWMLREIWSFFRVVLKPLNHVSIVLCRNFASKIELLEYVKDMDIS